MAEDNNTKLLAGELSEMTEKNIQFQKKKAKADADLLKEQRKTTVSQDKTTTQLSDKLSDLKTGQAALKEGQQEIAGANTETGDKLVAAQNDNEKTKRQESKENIKKQSKTSKLFTGLGKIFKENLSKLGKGVKDAALNPLKSVGFDPKAVGKSLLSIGAILGLVAFFKSPLFKKLKEFIAEAKPALMAVVNAVKTFISAFKDDIGPLIDSIVGIFKEAFNGVKDIVQGLFSGDASQFLSGMKSIFLDLPVKIVGYVGDAIFSVLENILAIFGIESEFVTNMKNMFRKLPETVEKAVQGVIDFFTVTIPEFFTETLPEKYEEFKTSVKEGVGNLLNSIIEPIINLKDTVMEKVDMGIAKIKAGVMNVVITIKNGFNSFVDGLKSMANKVIGLLNKIPGVDIDKFKLSTEKPEALVDADDILAADKAERLRKQKMKLAEEESVAETLDEVRTKKLMPEYSTAKGGLGFSSADLARAKHNYFGSDATIAQDNYADAVNLDDIVGGDRNEPAMRQHLEHIKNLEKENAELKEAASGNVPPIIQNNVNNSQMSSTTNRGTRTIPISAPMHPLYAQAQN